jgi:endonuclease/exonuclease/phosphatase family metal-dependent hydrolase
MTDSDFGPLIETSLRVMTWNVWHQFGPWRARRHAIAATLDATAPDVVALQEVWGASDGSFAGELAADLGYSHVDAWRAEHEGVTFGNAVLARWPITDAHQLALPAPEGRDELRTALRADVDGPRGPIQVFCTHLNWRFDQSAIRQEQVRAIADFVRKARQPRERFGGFPPIVCGDFNAVPDSDEIRLLTGRSTVAVDGLVFHDAWEVAGDGSAGHTWSNRNPFAQRGLEPDRRIDYVFVGWPKEGGAGHVRRCWLTGMEPVEGVLPSDHYAVVAEVRY